MSASSATTATNSRFAVPAAQPGHSGHLGAPVPASSANNPQSPPASSTLPGNPYPPEDIDTEFKEKYPPDPFGEEMAPNARVWRVYRDQATVQDEAMLDGWNKTLDILLIFAGLFSAVATAFIIESYKFLQPDFQEYTARALFMLLSSRNGSGIPESVLMLPDPSVVSVSTQSRWINGLWLTSLYLALAVALLCILVKQWLGQYKDRTMATSESFQYWARRRALYFRGVMRWHLPAFISTLPLLLHIALFFFLAGLVLLLWDLDRVIALTLLATTGVLGAFYAVCLVLPAWMIDCPSAVPLLEQIPRMWRALRNAAYRPMRRFLEYVLYEKSSVIVSLTSRMSSLLVRMSAIGNACTAGAGSLFKAIIALPADMGDWPLRLVQYLDIALDHRRYYSTQESRALEKASDELDASAIRWIVRSCPTPDVIVVACQATGALHPASLTGRILRRTEETSLALVRFMQLRYTSPPRDAAEAEQRAGDTARYLRAFAVVCSWDEAHFIPAMREWVKDLRTYDLPLLSTLPSHGFSFRERVAGIAARRAVTRDDGEQLLSQPKVMTSTALQVLRFPEISLSVRLAIMQRLDFQLLMADDIEHIMGTTLKDLGRNDHDDHDACDVSCALSLFSEFATAPPSVGLEQSDYPAAIWIVRQLVTISRQCSASSSCLRPIFWGFVNPEHISLATWTMDEITELARFLEMMTEPQSGFISQERSKLVTSAYCCLLHLARLVGAGDPKAEGIVADIVQAIAIAYSPSSDRYLYREESHPLPAWTRLESSASGDPNPANVNIADELLRSGPLLLLIRSGNESLWSFLCSVWNSNALHPRSCMLIHVLASHLCQHARESPALVDVPTLVDEFFARPWSLPLLLAAGQSDPHLDDLIISIVRHCVELRPRWWSSLLTIIDQLPNTDRANAAIKAYGRHIQIKITRKIDLSCAICPPRRRLTLSL